MKDYNTHVKTVITDKDTIKERIINVYACWSDVSDYNDGKEPDFYDIYEEKDGNQYCLNEGDPFYSKPTNQEIQEYITELWS